MYKPFEEISDSARLWVYQASKELNSVDVEVISSQTKAFINQWTAHGNNLHASFTIFHNRFLALVVDEEIHNATGCSIDSSVGFIKQLGNQLNVDFFDRMQVAFILNDNLQIESLNNFKNKVKGGEVSEDTMIFNNAITTKGELDTSWLLPIGKSWAGRFLPSAAM